MGISRLIAKGWILFCLYAAGHALAQNPAPGLIVGVLLFAAMGLLFAAGYGLSARDGATPLLTRLKPHHLLPDFNGSVFLIFVLLSFLNQIAFAPTHPTGLAVDALVNTARLAVPGQEALLSALAPCSTTGGAAFSSAFAWLLTVIFLASALSRLRLSAGLLRLERTSRPETLGAPLHATLLGLGAILCIQLFFVGSAYSWIACEILSGLPGAVLIGLAPLFTSYLMVTALIAALALQPER